jgi:hypothetical protein
MVELLKLRIAILSFSVKDFIFQERTLFFVYIRNLHTQNIFAQPVDFPDCGSSIGRKWGEE